MTAPLAVAPAAGEDVEETDAAAASNHVGAFFAAVAALQRETVARFEETVGRLSGFAMIGTGRNDRDLIMTLQDFDRLQQEFAALGDMIARFGSTVEALFPGQSAAEWLDRDVIAGISVGDLKERLLSLYRSGAGEDDCCIILDETVF